jgi:hypothetical protein
MCLVREAPKENAQPSTDTSPDSGVQDSADEVARQNKEKLLAQITDAKTFRGAETLTTALREQQRAAEDKENAEAPVWGAQDAPNQDEGIAYDQLRMQMLCTGSWPR